MVKALFSRRLIVVFLAALVPGWVKAQDIDVGNAAGEPGWNVQFNVSFTAAGPGVSGVEIDLAYNAENTPIRRTTSLRPDCTVSPGHGKNGSFAFHPVGCLPDECESIRAVLIDTDSTAVIGTGVLFTCHVDIPLSAAAGSYPLTPSRVGGGGPTGSAVPVASASGVIDVNEPCGTCGCP